MGKSKKKNNGKNQNSVVHGKIHKQNMKNKRKTASCGSVHHENNVRPSTTPCSSQQDSSNKHGKPTLEGSSLRDRMMNKLQGARFSNTYSADKTTKDAWKDAKQLFNKDPQSFQAYHDGFKKQATQWEINPLDTIIANLRKKSSSLVIADFGCGDARLAASVPNKVHSFDLVALNDRVTPCDMANTPLGDAEVDVVVFCLSLMGTNLAEYLQEANRVLKLGGILKIAEVESRFENMKKFIKDLNKLGFRVTSKNVSHSYFYFIDCKKEQNFTKKGKLPDVTLKPCIYKKR
ncbi:hypothetical protein B566_EDAN005938 [Ephemera danica]|nr:hypothetical protein B566_EDAN005938 [Ephemera danica]